MKYMLQKHKDKSLEIYKKLNELDK